MDSYGIDILSGGLPSIYDQNIISPTLQQAATSGPETINEVSNVSKQLTISNPFKNISLPELAHRLYPPTLDSGLFFSFEVPSQLATWPAWAAAIHIFLVLLFLFGLGDFLNAKQFIVSYTSNYFVLLALLTAFCFMFIGLPTALAVSVLTVAVLGVSHDRNPIIKVLLIGVGLVHLTLANMRTQDTFNDYDVAIIIVYIVLIAFISRNNNGMNGAYRPNAGYDEGWMPTNPLSMLSTKSDAPYRRAQNYKTTKSTYNDIDGGDVDISWSGLSDKMTMR